MTAGSIPSSIPRWRTGSRPGDCSRVSHSDPARQVRLWRMIRFDKTEVIPLDGSQAQAVGALLARTSTSDISDAHVVVCAQTADYAIVISDPLDLKRLDPALRLIRI